MNIKKLKSLIRDVPDFPKKGILFKDITTLLKDHKGFKAVMDIFYFRYREDKITQVIGIESSIKIKCWIYSS